VLRLQQLRIYFLERQFRSPPPLTDRGSRLSDRENDLAEGAALNEETQGFRRFGQRERL
jgi:hypothetical protein